MTISLPEPGTVDRKEQQDPWRKNQDFKDALHLLLDYYHKQGMPFYTLSSILEQMSSELAPLAREESRSKTTGGGE